MDFQISEGPSFIRGLSVYMYVCIHVCIRSQGIPHTHTHTHTHTHIHCGILGFTITNRKQWFVWFVVHLHTSCCVSIVCRIVCRPMCTNKTQ